MTSNPILQEGSFIIDQASALRGVRGLKVQLPDVENAGSGCGSHSSSARGVDPIA